MFHWFRKYSLQIINLSFAVCLVFLVIANDWLWDQPPTYLAYLYWFLLGLFCGANLMVWFWRQSKNK